MQKNVPFTEWFLVEPFEEFHRVITMEDFLENFGVDKWPPGKRVGYCGIEPTSPHECNMKVGEFVRMMNILIFFIFTFSFFFFTFSMLFSHHGNWHTSKGK